MTSNRFAVVVFSTEEYDDGESCGFAVCVGRFATHKEAEAYRVRRYGADHMESSVIED